MDKEKKVIFRDPTKEEMKTIMQVAKTIEQDARIGLLSMLAAGLLSSIAIAILILTHVSKWWIIGVSVFAALFWLATILSIPVSKKCKAIAKGIPNAKLSNGAAKVCKLNGSSCNVVGAIDTDKEISFDIDAKFLEPTRWDRSFTCVKSDNKYFVFTTLPNEFNPLYTHEVTIK